MNVKYNQKIIGKVDFRYNRKRFVPAGQKRLVELVKPTRQNYFRLKYIFRLFGLVLFLFLAYLAIWQANHTQAWEFPQVIYLDDMPAADYFDKYFGQDARIARAICQSESGLKVDSVNSKLNRDRSTDIGICQINLQAHWHKIPGSTYKEKYNSLLSPEINVAVAKLVYDSQGWFAWTDYRNGKYNRYLKGE